MRVTRLLLLLLLLLGAAVQTHAARLPPAEGDGRIVGGQAARLGLFPHQALVLGDQSFLCGGSLLSPTKVLTAAHCVLGFRELFVRLGGVRLDEQEPTAWATVTPWALVHPDYDPVLFSHDVAVVHLLKPAPLSKWIKVVELPLPLEVNTTFTGQLAYISGWGQTSGGGEISMELRWAGMQVVPNSICSMFFPAGYIVDSTLCAVDINASMCGGDSGGPLVMRVGRRYKQIGVNSFTASGSCDTDVPNAFVRVTAVLDWIRRVTGDD